MNACRHPSSGVPVSTISDEAVEEFDLTLSDDVDEATDKLTGFLRSRVQGQILE